MEEKKIGLSNFWKSFYSYFTQKHILLIIAFILLYRLGEASLEKMIYPFMLGGAESGGLGLSLEEYSFIKGTLATAALILGNIAGGVFLAKYGFKKCIWFFAAMLNLPSLLYVVMASVPLPVEVITLMLSFEQFGYGLGMMAFTVFVLEVSQRGNFPTSHYAISTGIMGLGMMVPAMVSGFLQLKMGYSAFFLFSCLLGVPSLLIIPFVLKARKDWTG
ncbi:putative MFS family arabinose efflux permease [Elusimicrobium posterum]|uniref:hypothetical protein n=1 Tax=Elusimicrobium posterum TaxID=3116653 RepID=UPI003C70CCF1